MSRSGQKNDLYASALRIGKSENPPCFFYRIGAAIGFKYVKPVSERTVSTVKEFYI